MHGHDDVNLAASTIAVSAGRPKRSPDAPLNAPITMASAFIPGGNSGYGRHGNPTFNAFETVLGELEGGRTLAFASGMAATTAVFELVPAGGIVVAPQCAYNGTLTQLADRARRKTIKLRLVDMTNTAEVTNASKDAALVWVESPTNPTLELADIKAISNAASATGAAIAVDNTFATPLRQKPLDLGADIVVHSASKLLSGHSDVILGAVVTNDDRLFNALAKQRESLGSIPGALEIWLATRGIRTLHVRLDRAEANAREIYARLSKTKDIVHPRYPGFGTIVSFEVKAGADIAQKITETSELITYTTSLGGVESTWERRRRIPSEPTTVPESLIRLSVGIEHVDDLWDDIVFALKIAR
ncbi:MAG TPA: aminotransferase class I/II-fold pyridoxal phosphate-dependent enzyme [Aeromicrobium sp.]|nr:aminotransferase class I/II-fold pyridoxal phosphate-dependent enzyme [Aeromicrobium sp.]